MKDLSTDLQKQLKSFETLINKKLPEHTAMVMEDKYNQSFEQQENAFKKTGKWNSLSSDYAKRKRKNDKGDGILSKTGALKDSAETVISGRQVSLTAGYEVGAWNLAEIHNEGLSPQPKRQFMPTPGEESPELSKEIETYLDAQMDKIFK